MSDKLSMPAVDKVQIKVQVKAPVFVRLEKMSESSHLSINAICGALLDEATSSVELTTDDLNRVNQIISENISKREAAKAEKGLK